MLAFLIEKSSPIAVTRSGVVLGAFGTRVCCIPAAEFLFEHRLFAETAHKIGAPRGGGRSTRAGFGSNAVRFKTKNFQIAIVKFTNFHASSNGYAVFSFAKIKLYSARKFVRCAEAGSQCPIAPRRKTVFEIGCPALA